MARLDIAVVTGSTRPGRHSRSVADWVVGRANNRAEADYELVDLSDFDLPLFDEPYPPTAGKPVGEHTRRWATVAGRYDGYVFVTPEYNHSTSASLKNALDFLYEEWNDKAAAFVSYGYGGGVRAVEHLRQISSAVQLAHVRQQVSLSLHSDFGSNHECAPAEHQCASLATLFGQLERWAGALRLVRKSDATHEES